MMYELKRTGQRIAKAMSIIILAYLMYLVLLCIFKPNRIIILFIIFTVLPMMQYMRKNLERDSVRA